jgi:hypothetical protein
MAPAEDKPHSTAAFLTRLIDRSTTKWHHVAESNTFDAPVHDERCRRNLI